MGLKEIIEQSKHVKCPDCGDTFIEKDGEWKKLICVAGGVYCNCKHPQFGSKQCDGLMPKAVEWILKYTHENFHPIEESDYDLVAEWMADFAEVVAAEAVRRRDIEIANELLAFPSQSVGKIVGSLVNYIEKLRGGTQQ